MFETLLQYIKIPFFLVLYTDKFLLFKVLFVSIGLKEKC